MLKKTKKEKQKKIEKQTKLIKKMVKEHLHPHVSASERSRLLLIEAYASCIGKQKTLPTLTQLEKMTGLTTPTIMKHQKDIVSESKSEFQEAQAFYDLAKVSKIASEGQLEFAREAMISIIGDSPDIKDLNDDFPISKPDPIEQDQ